MLSSAYSTDSFTQFMNYANPIVNKRNNNEKLLSKFKKEQAKLKEKRTKKMKKYQNSNQYNGWLASYNLLKSLSSGG